MINRSRAGPAAGRSERFGMKGQIDGGNMVLIRRNKNVFCPNGSQNIACIYNMRSCSKCELCGCCELAEFRKFIKGELNNE